MSAISGSEVVVLDFSFLLIRNLKSMHCLKIKSLFAMQIRSLYFMHSFLTSVTSKSNLHFFEAVGSNADQSFCSSAGNLAFK